MDRQELNKKARDLPLLPGVYIMKDRHGEVIYVGKAKALKNRVLQYFQSGSGHSLKTAHMVSNVFDFDVIVTGTEFEALVLECSLIKQHRPKYNILLKDDKGYPYIRFPVKEPYPRMEIVSRPEKDGARYFGPYTGRRSARLAIEAISGLLKLPTCSRQFPRDIGKGRPCLNAHLGRCRAVCTGNVSEEEYRELSLQVCELLDGKLDKLAMSLEAEMQKASEDLEFERAAEIRDRIRSLTRLDMRQKITSSAFADLDVLAYGQGTVQGCIVILHFIEGTLHEKEIHMIKDGEEADAPEILSGFAKQYYSLRSICPKTILVSHALDDSESMEQYLAQIAGHGVKVLCPARGKKRDLVRMGVQNAEDELRRGETQKEKESRTLQLLSELLGLEKIERMEAYDISNTGNWDVVGSMIVFENARPKKDAYRRFKMKTVEGQNDYASMQEMLRRRFQRFLDKDEKFSVLPDVVLIDGGVQHARAVAEVFDELGIRVPLYGMVKDDHHRTRALVDTEGNELGIRATPPVFALIGRMQEEAHRFAITYHRSLRGKRGYGSQLDAIEGVGPKRHDDLIRRFRTIKGIREASEEELREVVPEAVALSIYRHFHAEERESGARP